MIVHIPRPVNMKGIIKQAEGISCIFLPESHLVIISDIEILCITFFRLWQPVCNLAFQGNLYSTIKSVLINGAATTCCKNKPA